MGKNRKRREKLMRALIASARQDELNAKYFHSGWDAAMQTATEEGGIAYDRDGYRAMWEDSRAITRAVHEALETVEAPPAESLAGRVLSLHEVLENQRRADAATADQLAKALRDANAAAAARRRDLDEVVRALDLVGAPTHGNGGLSPAGRVAALATQRDNWKREASGAAATREERDRLTAKVAELADLANTRQATIQRQAAATIEAETERDEWKARHAELGAERDELVAELDRFREHHKGGGCGTTAGNVSPALVGVQETAPMPAGHCVGDGCVEPEGVPLAAEPVRQFTRRPIRDNPQA